MTHRQTVIAGLLAAALAFPIAAAVAQTEAPVAPPPAADPTDAPAPATPPPPAPYTPPAAAPAAETPAATAPATAEQASPAAPAQAAVPAADDAALAAVGALPTGIEDVQIVGPWMEGERNGVWRTVMMQVGTAEKETYRFFIQQIERAGETVTILSTTEITEMPGIDGAIVGYRAEEPSEEDPSGLTLFFDIVPSDGEIAETYELHFFKDQPYTFGPATN